MDLYQPNGSDHAFNSSDLEWLYRQQDIDGTSLSSRLSQLVPISFVAASDALRRRRMVSIDSWETTSFSYANDNPQNVFDTNGNVWTLANNTTYNGSNHRFTKAANARLANQSPGQVTPTLAHRDRRINLNFPFPVSNRYDEPIRQKWVSETYAMLKATLPPKAVDTPIELAQLSQYLVNVVDFRDPDCTMTRFVNPDVIYAPPDATTPMPVYFASTRP